LSRDILVAKNSPDKVNITSRIQARSVGAGSGGESRVVRLRVHPLMKLVNPMHSVIQYTSIDGSKHVHEANMEFGDITIEGSDRPNGEWMLKDTESGLAVIDRFNINEVALCLISWGPGSVTMELWSEERPVSKDTPIRISHEYEFIDNHTDDEPTEPRNTEEDESQTLQRSRQTRRYTRRETQQS